MGGGCMKKYLVVGKRVENYYHEILHVDDDKKSALNMASFFFEKFPLLVIKVYEEAQNAD